MFCWLLGRTARRARTTSCVAAPFARLCEPSRVSAGILLALRVRDDLAIVPAMRSIRLLAPLLALLLLLGCPRSRPTHATLADASKATLAARDAAKAARDRNEPKAAALAAEDAADCLEQAERLAAATASVGTADAPAPLQEARRAAREAKHLAEEAAERERLEAALSGFKATAYRGVRAVAITGTFKGLAEASRQADARGLDALHPQVKQAALDAARWAETTNGRKPRADGAPDWKGIATDMDALAAAPPPAIGIVLTVGFFALGRTNLALIEAEALEPEKEQDPTNRLALHLLRGFVRSSTGHKRLAILEVEAGLASIQGKDVTLVKDVAGAEVGAAEVLGGLHLLLAVIYGHQKDWAACDREVALALRDWPDNPVAAFVTGERLLASGDKQRAAESLEAAVKGEGEEAEWLAARLAQRARDIRDGKADADDGLLLGDPVFLGKLAAHALWKAAEKSDAAARAKVQVEKARTFCDDLVKKLPGQGEADVAPVTTR